MALFQCPQLYAMIGVMVGLAVIIAATAGPAVLTTMIRAQPIGHTFVILTQLGVLAGICYLKAPITGWFVFAMLAAAAITTYGLGAYIVLKADDLRPLVKESMECVSKATTPEQRKQCQARALEHLRAAIRDTGIPSKA